MTVSDNVIKGLEEISDHFKEKEEKPVEICGRLSTLTYGNCPRCGKYMNSELYPHWCGFCGQAVKWNG